MLAWPSSKFLLGGNYGELDNRLTEKGSWYQLELTFFFFKTLRLPVHQVKGMELSLGPGCGEPECRCVCTHLRQEGLGSLFPAGHSSALSSQAA